MGSAYFFNSVARYNVCDTSQKSVTLSLSMPNEVWSPQQGKQGVWDHVPMDVKSKRKTKPVVDSHVVRMLMHCSSSGPSNVLLPLLCLDLYCQAALLPSTSPSSMEALNNPWTSSPTTSRVVQFLLCSHPCRWPPYLLHYLVSFQPYHFRSIVPSTRARAILPRCLPFATPTIHP